MLIILHWIPDKSYIRAGLEHNQKTEGSETEIVGGH